jgi:hypothetical protein
VIVCETCKAQWDEQGDAMALVIFHEDPFGIARKYSALTKLEWARVGRRLEPGGGNLTCSKCDADFIGDDEHVTPLRAEHDPYGFASEYGGCSLTYESLRFLGVGKTSGKPGPVCAECRTEFDSEGDYVRLKATANETLEPYLEQARPLADWHRLVRGLPAIDEEPAWKERFDAALRIALLGGEISWAERRRPEMLWRSDAELHEPRRGGRIVVYRERIEFQARKNGWAAPRDVIRSATAADGTLEISVIGEPRPLRFSIQPETVAVDLASGRREVVLDAEDLALLLNMPVG